MFDDGLVPLSARRSADIVMVNFGSLYMRDQGLKNQQMHESIILIKYYFDY